MRRRDGRGKEETGKGGAENPATGDPELEAIAFQDPKEYVKTEESEGEPRQVPRVVSEMKPRARRVIETVNFQKDGGVTYKMYSKLKALEILGRMEGQPIPGEEGAGLSEGTACTDCP